MNLTAGCVAGTPAGKSMRNRAGTTREIVITKILSYMIWVRASLSRFTHYAQEDSGVSTSKGLGDRDPVHSSKAMGNGSMPTPAHHEASSP
jgi:hypothetical protein